MRVLVCEVSSRENQAAAEMKGLVDGTCPSYRGISEWLQCGGGELKRDLLWAAGEMLQLLHYLRPMLGPQVMRIPAVSLLVCHLLDEGFMCKAWCFRGWVELVARALFHRAPERPTCSTGRTAVCWNVLKFVKFIAQKSRSHDQSKAYSKDIVFFLSNFPHETNLASSFGLATIFITMSFLFILFLLLWCSGLVFTFE